MAPEPIAGRYRLLEPLGRGAMSAVWLADDEELARRVAVKLLAPRADRARFEREARAAAALSDPHICALYDYGEEDGKPFMVLEYLPNGSLEDRLSSGEPLPDADTRRIATEIAEGLAHAHARGLVHRDLKPANVLFDAEDRAKIADFGIARLGDSRTLTEAGTVLGTASTISPEQAAGLPAGPASDVYSFGVILFRMLTGRLPFVAANAMEVVRMHRDDAPPPVSALRPEAPPALASLANAALAKDPAARPADGSALLEALGGTAAVTVAAAAVAPPFEEATQVLSREPASPRRRLAALPLVRLVVGILVLLGAGIAAAVVVSGKGGDAPPAAHTTAPGLSVPTVPAAADTTAPSAPASTGPATTATTAPATSSTRPASTSRPTTAPATTAPTTTARTTAPTTAPTTFPTTTAPAPPPPPTTTPTAPTTVPTTTAAPATPTVPTTTAATTAP